MEALLAGVRAVYAAWRRIRSNEAELEIWRVMHRYGLTRNDAEANPAHRTRVVRRCITCPSVEACQDWLASGSRDGLDEFCPNAAFLVKAGAGKDLRLNR